MKKYAILVGLITLLMVHASLAEDAENVPLAGEYIKKMTVEFEWAAENACSELSPEIKLKDVPPPVLQFTVYLKDLNYPQYFHGGGLVRKRFNKVIKAGELNSYHGPCPPTGETHQYAMRIYGIDVDGRVIAYGEKILPYTSD